MKTKINLKHIAAALLLLAAAVASTPALAQGTAFVYQGRLNNGTNPATGIFDMTFSLYNASSGGSSLAGPVTNTAVSVTNGLFTTVVDFGAGVFTGSSNWLSIGVRTNGAAVAFTALSPRQQVIPTPYAIFAEGANAAGLSGAVPVAQLPSIVVTNGGSGVSLTGVALLAGTNTFYGNENINGAVNINDGTGPTILNFADLNIGPGGYYSGEQHSINFNDSAGHIGSLIVGWNGSVGYFNVANLYDGTHETNTTVLTVLGNRTVGIGTTAAPQQYLSVQGGVNIDQANYNAGFINNGNTNGYGITFGSGSGEGIASQRTTGLNQYGLDFYTGSAHRMSILQGGNVGIGTTNPASKLEVAGDVRIDGNHLYLEPNSGSFANDGLVFGDGGLPGINYSGYGPFLCGYDGGALGALSPNTVCLSWDYSGDVWVSNNLSTASLTVRGEFAVVNGLGGEQAYMGGDGYGGDVQIGSLNPSIMNVAFYNASSNAYMHIYCSSITIEGGADLAEPFKITAGNEDVPQGAVVVIDEQNPGHLKMSDQSYDTHVAGVVSGANGINPGIQMRQQGLLEGGKNVALTGRVYVQADASNGAIKPGDLLTTSSTPGRAMRVTDHARAAGAILGKAMTGLSEGKGMVLVLVTLQ